MEIAGILGAQVIVQVEQADGTFTCVAFGNVATPRCAYIVIAGNAAGAVQLGAAVVAAIKASGPDVQDVQTACLQPQHGGPLGCVGAVDPKCQKLLVLASDGASHIVVPSFASMWKSSGDYSVLPVLPETARTNFTTLIPFQYHKENARYWNKTIDETVPAVFAAAAMTVEVPRLFISYRQKDSAAFAVQLFDAMSHTGFDVFLDHYRVPPAVNFQERLTQELGDKGMVVVLESEGILDSKWTTEEINTAKACELTLVALHLPNGKKVPEIDDAARRALAAADFGGAFSDTTALNNARLDEIVTWIEQEHNIGVLRRRGSLHRALAGALKLRGITNVCTDDFGLMHVTTPGGKEYKIWPSVRLPELDDFHTAALGRMQPQYGAVIGLSRLFALTTRTRYEWLSNLCEVAMIDKGQLGVAADRIANGDPL